MAGKTDSPCVFAPGGAPGAGGEECADVAYSRTRSAFLRAANGGLARGRARCRAPHMRQIVVATITMSSDQPPAVGVFARALMSALAAGASEVGIDTLLCALDDQSRLSEPVRPATGPLLPVEKWELPLSPAAPRPLGHHSAICSVSVWMSSVVPCSQRNTASSVTPRYHSAHGARNRLRPVGAALFRYPHLHYPFLPGWKCPTTQELAPAARADQWSPTSIPLRTTRGSGSDGHSSFAYSALASFRMGMPGSASFQSVRKSWYAARALARAS